jgi:hypothetical protein
MLDSTQYVDMTPALENRIINSYLKGETRKGICAEYRISSGTLYRVLDSHGIPRRRKAAGRTQAIVDNYSDTLKERIYRDYHNGVSTYVLKKTYNLHKNAIYVIVDQIGAKHKRERVSGHGEGVTKTGTLVSKIVE